MTWENNSILCYDSSWLFGEQVRLPRPPPHRLVSAPMRCRFMVAVMLGFFAETAAAQVIPGDSPSTGIGAAVANSRSRPILGISRAQDYPGTEYQSRPEPKPSNRKTASDPWAGIRESTPASSTADRHRAY